MEPQITAQMVKALSEASGASMMACKHALRDCDGDFDQALRKLRDKSGDDEPEAETGPA